MLLLITAAGKGSRFKKAGINIPKPLISIKNKTLLETHLESFDFSVIDRLVITTQTSDNIKSKIIDKLCNLYNGTQITWLEIDGLLPGQLCTSYHALTKLIEEDKEIEKLPMWIHNCDTGFTWNKQLSRIEGFSSMPVFIADGTHWSFGKPDPNNINQAIRIAEKNRISDLASIGMYGFESIKQFIQAAEHELKYGIQVNGEHYIAPMLQSFIERGKIVTLPRVSGVRLYGTPNELCKTFNLKLEELISENT